MSILNKEFYLCDTLQVARALLGKKLVRRVDGALLTGMITETEAYCGREDTACHGHRGKTARNSVMFGPAGQAYVYFTYGLHHLINLVTEEDGNPCAVLLRSVLPLAGIEEMKARRRGRDAHLTDGPARLCQAMGVDLSFNGWDLTAGRRLWVEDYKSIPDELVTAAPRIGIAYAAKEDREALWRFLAPSEVPGMRRNPGALRK